MRNSRHYLWIPILILLVGILIADTSENTAAAHFDRDGYKALVAEGFSSLDALALDFGLQQAAWLPILPPDPAWPFVEDAMTPVSFFDPAGFPDTFSQALIGIEVDGYTSYPVTVCEDPVTRDRVFFNVLNIEIGRVSPEPGYDPFTLARTLFPEAYQYPYPAEDRAYLEAAYDPSRVRVRYTLLDHANLIRYVVLQSKPSPEPVLPDKEKPSKDGGFILLRAYTGPPVTAIKFTAIEQSNGAPVLTVAYPWVSGDPASSYTNRLELFGCTNLFDYWWFTLGATNVSSTTNWIEWTDASLTTNDLFRFYAAGNADQDSDSDDLTDAREEFLYHSSPTNSDTDGDTLSDYEEAINRNTDPSNSDTGKPVAVISYPTNSFTWVWMP